MHKYETLTHCGLEMWQWKKKNVVCILEGSRSLVTHEVWQTPVLSGLHSTKLACKMYWIKDLLLSFFQIMQEYNQQLFMQENPVFHKAHDFQFQPSECDTVRLKKLDTDLLD